MSSRARPRSVLALLRLGRRIGLGSLLGRLRTLTTRHPGVVCLRDQRTALDRVDRIDDAIVARLFGSHEVVPVGVVDDLVQRLARVAGGGIRGGRGAGSPSLSPDTRTPRA